MKKFLLESKHFLKIGIPILGSQMSYMIMYTTDTIVSGRYGADELSGLVIANAFTFPIYMLFQGVMFGITPIVAQLYGAKEFTQIGEKMRQIFWVALFLAVLIFFIFLFISEILIFFPMDKGILGISISYLKAVSFGMFFYVLFRFLSSYSEGMTLTLPVFSVVFIGSLINIPLDIIFAFGYFGFPEMGSVGCGYATSLVSLMMLVSLGFIVTFSKKYKKTNLMKEFSGPSKETSLEIFKLGTPIGIGIFVEMSMFSGAAIIIGQLGEIILAGHAIAINIAGIVFMLPLAIGLAAATRIGNLIGEKRFTDAQYSSYTSVSLCLLGAFINMITLMTLKETLSSFYTTDILVLGVATHLLLFAAIFQIPDGIQMGSLGALRGYKDTFIPMIYLIISYWIFAIPFGYFLTNRGFNGPLGAEGMWIGMILGLVIFSIFIFIRLRLISSRFIEKLG
jgi:MATE family multidrug resistance protein